MTKLNGHGNGHDQANVTSLDEARKRAAEKAKAEKRAAGAAASDVRGPRTARDWLIGGLVVVMALSYIASFFVGSPQVSPGGVQ